METPNEYADMIREISEDPRAWRDYANCLDASPDDDRLLFPWGRPEPTESETDHYISSHCVECPVRQQCLDFAVETSSVGIWGGFRLNFADSAKLKKLRSETGCLTVEDAEEILRKGDER